MDGWLSLSNGIRSSKKPLSEYWEKCPKGLDFSGVPLCEELILLLFSDTVYLGEEIAEINPRQDETGSISDRKDGINKW